MTATVSQPFELRKMRIEDGSPLRYFLDPAPADGGHNPQANPPANDQAAAVELTRLLGSRLTITHTGALRCQACGNNTRKSYAQGHCYPCFKRLARCDLCVMAPHRCHYDKGTCREPEWGESFCMQPHLVYLANSSSIKVGITRDGQELGRWRDQGALQGRIIARTATRRAAGELEVQLAKTFGDRSQWRSLVSANAESIDLAAAAEQARELVPDPGSDVSYVEDAPTHELSYPVNEWPELQRLNFKKAESIGGKLTGIKGQYLLFDSGVFNVREHTGYEVTLFVDSTGADGGSTRQANAVSQNDLFS